MLFQLYLLLISISILKKLIKFEWYLILSYAWDKCFTFSFKIKTHFFIQLVVSESVSNECFQIFTHTTSPNQNQTAKIKSKNPIYEIWILNYGFLFLPTLIFVLFLPFSFNRRMHDILDKIKQVRLGKVPRIIMISIRT